MHTPGIAVADRYTYADLFDRFNLISSLMYEGAKGIGHIVLVNPESELIDYMIRFREPVPFEEPRWARKALQMAAADVALIADSERIYGLGRLKATHAPRLQNAFMIDFLDHYHWELRCGMQVMLRSRYGQPKLPHELVGRVSFTTNYARLFPNSSEEDRSHLWGLFNVVIRQDHGSMIVVAEDAASESQRLAQQGTGVEPVRLSEELLRRVSAIDGTIILDPHGNCHAIGVILDGTCDLAIANTYYMGLMLTNEAEPEQKEWAASARIVYPNAETDGTQVNAAGAFIAKHAPNPENANKLIEFLLSDGGRFVQGQVIHANGGAWVGA